MIPEPSPAHNQRRLGEEKDDVFLLVLFDAFLVVLVVCVPLRPAAFLILLTLEVSLEIQSGISQANIRYLQTRCQLLF